MRIHWLAPLWVLAAWPSCADVTVRYQSDYQINVPGPAKEAAEKSIKAQIDKFANRAIQMKNGKVLAHMGAIVTIADYNTRQMMLLDGEHKSYASFPFADFTDKMVAAMPKMPDEAQKVMETIKSSVETRKTGRTDTILGIQVEEREAVMLMEIPAPAPNPGGMKMKMVMQIWTATQAETLRNQAVREFTGYSLYSNAVMNPTAMLQKMGNNLPATMAKDFKAIIPDNAMMLRMRMETYIEMPPEVAKMMGTDPNTPMATVTQEAAEVSSASVDASIFNLPADCQKVDAEVILKTMMTVPPPPASAVTKVDQSQDLAKQEQAFRSILATDPENIGAKRMLASVLFRENKVDEATAILNTINKEQ